MRINTVTASHFLSHTSLILSFPKDVHMTLIAGPNGAGKSAAAQAIRLALFGDPVRGLSKKNELSNLKQHGQKTGIVSVDTDLGVCSLSLSTGKHEPTPATLSPMLAYTMDPSLFFAEPDAGKRAQVIMKACGIRQTKERIFGDLEAMGFDRPRIEALEWAAGFTHAEKAAKAEATEARARWKFVTGEAYGEVKAATWEAPAVEAIEANEDDLAHAISVVQDRVQKAQERRAELKAAHDAYQRAEKARQTAQVAPKLAEDIGIQRDALQRLEDELETARKTATTPGGVVIACPCCQEQLVITKNGNAIAKYEAPQGSPARAVQRLKELEPEIATKRAMLASLESQLRVAEAARDALGDVPEPPTDADLQMAESEVTRHQGMLDEAQGKMRDLQKHAGDVAAAAKRTEQAAQAHADVLAYTALAEAIHGLPEKYIGEALVTINGWMDEIVGSAFAEDCPSIVLQPDMSLRYGATLYELASESEKWRMRLALAYAIAQASQVGVLMMDEFDVVQPADRGDILAFFEGNTDVQSILIGTLKTKYDADSGGQCIWMGA
jgi:hypothetical protein